MVATSCNHDHVGRDIDDAFVEYIPEDLQITPASFHKLAGEALGPELDLDRRVAKEGDITLQVTDLEATKWKVAEWYKQFGARVTLEELNQSEYRISYRQVIQVPASLFDSLIYRLEKMVPSVDDKTVEADDVTEDFIDLESRLKTKKEIATRYREILNLAHRVDEVLSVESELGSVREDIEAMEARLAYLNNQVDYGRLDLRFYVIVEKNESFAAKLISSLANGWDGLQVMTLFIISVWPFVLLTMFAIWAVVVLYSRRFSKRWSTH